MERSIVTQNQRIHSAEGVETMLYGCATWIMRSQDFDSMRIAHHKLRLRVVGFQRKNRTGYKPLSYGEAFERTASQRTEAIFRKRQLGLAGFLIR